MTNRPRTKAQLAAELRAVADQLNGDPEQAHNLADDLLLAYINNADVRTAFEAIEKWYA